MRVAFVTQTYPRFPGDTAGPFIHSLAAGLAEQGHDVRVLAPWDARLAGGHFDARVPLTTFRYALSDGAHRLGYSQTMSGDVALRPIAYLAAPGYVVAGALALRRLTREQGSEIVNAHWLLPNGVVALPAVSASLEADHRGSARSARLVVSLHGTDVFVARRNPLFRAAARAVLRRAAAVTGCSPEFTAAAVELGAPAERCHLLPYGVDTDAFAPGAARPEFRRQLEIPDGAPVVLGLGRLVFKKGFDVLLDAFAMVRRAVPDAHLVIAGAGDLLAPLQEQARRLGVAEAVRFPGVVYREALADYYRLADVVAVPSVHDAAGNVDGLPNVLLEAMACARPVVATAVSGIPQALDDARHGRLVAERDTGGLAGSILELLQDGRWAGQLGAAARARMEREFTWPAIARRLATIYEEARR